jgi:hypothetical protein
MRIKRPRSGPRGPATDAFLLAVGARDVPRDPDDEDSWKHRLDAVEKRIATTLQQPPVLYSMVSASAARNTLRLSVGLSLSIGVPQRRRYAIYVEQGAGAVIAEGDSLPADDPASAFLTNLPSWADAEMAKGARAILDACARYELLSDVQAAIARLSEARHAELTSIESLYARRPGTDQKLYGMRERGTEGSASVEAEHRRLQQLALERYAVQVRVRVLSVGVLSAVQRPPRSLRS